MNGRNKANTISKSQCIAEHHRISLRPLCAEFMYAADELYRRQ